MDGLIIDQATVNKAGAPTPGAGPSTAPRAATEGGAPLITDMLQLFGRQSELSAEGLKYIEVIKEHVTKELGADASVARITDKVLDVFRVTYGNSTIMLTLGETYISPAETYIPPTEQITPAACVVRDTIGGVLLNNIVVMPADYKDVAKMAAHLVRTLGFNSGKTGHLTIDSLRKGKFTISTNISEVRQAISKLNPKAQMPRTDIGLVLYSTEEVGVQNSPIKQTQIVLVVGGYTKMVSTAGSPTSYGIGASAPSFIPIVTITSILSQIMTSEMISLAIPLATEEFIRRAGWLKPYTRFDKKNPSMNLGHLILGDNGKPFFIENMTMLLEFARTHIGKPHLAIDVTDGVPRIPGIEGLRYGNDTVQRGIARFLNVDAKVTMGDMVSNRYLEFIGEISSSGEDTRNIDYLTLIANGVTDMNILLRYLYISNEPQKRLELISKSYEVKSLYTNVCVVLDAAYIDAMSAKVAEKFRPLWENINAPENNIGSLGTGNGANFQLSPVFGANTVGNSWNGANFNLFGG